MRLGIQLLNTDAQLNLYKTEKQVVIYQGDVLNINFQLIDLDQGGIRYVPTTAATVFVEIPKFPDTMMTLSNQRQIVDYSIRRNAAMLFPNDDRSIWYMPLVQADTAFMNSSNMRVTLTDGMLNKVTILPMAIKVFCSESNATHGYPPGSNQPYTPGEGR
jgi:hypothetical protein